MKLSGDNKRYYWLKLKDDFFRQKEIKQLRKIAGGEVFIIIYLKMLLRSLKDDGKLYYEGIDENFASELALDIDEDVENVKMTVAYLQAKGILVQSSVDEYELLTAGEMTGSECYSAERVRRFRKNQKQLALQGNSGVTAGNEEKREKREEKETREKSEREKRKRFIPPTIEELRAYAKEKGYTNFDPEAFIDFYESKGWMVGSNKMQSWKSAVNTWVRREAKRRGSTPSSPRYDMTRNDNVSPELLQYDNLI